MASGSEVHLALEAATALEDRGVPTRVVSFPSWEIFERQTPEYKAGVFPSDVPRLAIEAGTTIGWERYAGSRDRVIGLDRFGASAPGDVAYAELGFNVQAVVDKAAKIVEG
jgi:transketolase